MAPGHKRKATETAAPLPRKVLKRNQRGRVERETVQFWDKHSPQIMTPEEVKRKFFHAAKRASQLKQFKLLYEYERIHSHEVRLLFINPAKRRDMDLFVSIQKFEDSDVGADPKQEYEDSDVGADPKQEYEALSYHWGPGPADKPVFLSSREVLPKVPISDLAQLRVLVPDYDKGQRFYVRPNLDKALRYLRHTTEIVILWVDAICINQSDEEIEKPAQIAKMKSIYNKASNVCIWLGDGKTDGKNDRTIDFQAAMDFSQRIIQLKELDKILDDIKSTRSWSNLLDLMRCSWFSRRWVIQELALAREATVHCGDKHVPWQEFADAIGLFALNFDRIRVLFRQSQEDTIFQNYKNFDELEPLGAKVLVDAITNTFRKNADDSIFEPVSDLETLVSSLSFFESSDPRDTIFALLNIASESVLPEPSIPGVVKPPQPNYQRDILEVYSDFLEWVVYSSQSLDILCRHWAIPEREKPGGRKNPTPLITLPSWIQTILKSPWGYQEQSFNGRINGDSIVGKAGRRRYNASRWRKPEVRFGARRTPFSSPQIIEGSTALVATRQNFPEPAGTSTSHRLFVKGIEIGAVNWTYGPVSRGVVTKECLEKGGWKSQDRMTKVPDKLWRTLVADRTADGENPPPWYHRAALHCMALADNNDHIGTHELLDRGNSADGRLPQIVTEYLKRVQAVTWNRKFIEATPQINQQAPEPNGLGSQPINMEPYFGLGPPDTVYGDRICILFGCSVPCILRPCLDKVKGSSYYTFVGEAYIYGRMDGEALAMLSVDELKYKTTEFLIL
ncbi:hypothetical protein N0V83_010353 [Neocucurbitaria cava]|uniref:Heterokaryon incompatibility domain-containing protein n=1 Tax=Neocucurbitaria cava TaxID=798079 RepID=A0A9W8XZG8_9PLEO|nr:hypothetical protein N0V83_010353 [Neocucurbitaria cava]